MTSSPQVFFSAVTSEHAPIRAQLARILARGNINVDHQEIFPNVTVDILRKLAMRIRDSHLVVHVLGHQTGSPANADAIEDLFDTKNEGHIVAASFHRELPGLENVHFRGITYTQWEAILAIYYGVPLLIYSPEAAADTITGKILPSFGHHEHLGRIFRWNRNRPYFFSSLSDLAPIIVEDVNYHFQTHPVSKNGRRPDPVFSADFIAANFVGREEQLDGILKEIEIRPHINVLGPGGSGKTWLANELILLTENRFPDGRWVVELANLVDSSLVQREVGRTLGLIEKDGRMPLSEYLHHRRSLLVLDNCEHLVSACVGVIKELAGCKDLRIVTTSTRPLGTAREYPWRVKPFSFPPSGALTKEEVSDFESVKLLLAHAGSPDLRVTDANAAVIADICRDLDGIPLAIKIAAARCTSSSVAALEIVKAGLLAILKDCPYEHDPERHRTVKAVVEWSYKLLSREQQDLLVKLSVFRDGFSAAAVRSICCSEAVTEGEVIRMLDELVNRSMVNRESVPEELDSSGQRFRILQTIKLFGEDKLNEMPGEAGALGRRHKDWFTTFVEERAKIMENGGDQKGVSSQLLLEHDNIRRAMDWCTCHGETVASLRLGVGMWRFWEVRGFHAEGRQELGALLPLEIGEADERLRAVAFTGFGMLSYRQGYIADAEEAFRSALSMEEGFLPRNELRVCMCRTDIGNALSLVGHWEDALEMYRTVLVDSEKIQNRRQLAIARFNYARLSLHLGHLDRSDEIARLLQQSEEGFRAGKNESDIGYPIELAGWLMFFLNRYDEAVASFKRARDNRRSIGSEMGQFQALDGITWCQLYKDEANAAKQTLKEERKLLEKLKSDVAIAQFLECGALLALKLGKPEDCLTFLSASRILRAARKSFRPPIFVSLENAWQVEASARLSEEEICCAEKRGGANQVEVKENLQDLLGGISSLMED